VTIVESRPDFWEVLAGRAPGKPVGPHDADVWRAVSDRLNPAKATPRLRDGVEVVQLQSARGAAYVMLRSPDEDDPCYLRLTPEEWALVECMDGQRSVARLVADFARITGRLAPEQVTRVVADLAGNRLLDELPVDAFKPLAAVARRGRAVETALAFARGRRVVLANVDPLVGLLYRLGGKLLFTRLVALFLGGLGVLGLGAFGVLWLRGDQSVFLSGGSYLTGAIVLLLCNVFALACHELAHALAVKHAGRRVPAAGFLVYFGIPSVFVDTTDVWMSSRRARIVTTAAGPAAGLVLAGTMSLLALLFPPIAPLAFKLAFVWYLNALFNLNPFIALDGYYLLMDWLEVPNLRARALAWVGARLRRKPPKFRELDGEGRLIALYGMLAVAWIGVAANLAWRIYSDRLRGLATGLWHGGFTGKVGLLIILIALFAPALYVLAGKAARTWRRRRQRMADARVHEDLPARLDALRASGLGGLAPEALTELGREARWLRPRDGEPLMYRGAAVSDLFVVVEGIAEARRPGDPGGVIRQRIGAGGLIGLANTLTGNPASLEWYTVGATLLAVPAPVVVTAVGELPSPAPADLAELEDLLDETPQFSTVSAEAYLGITARAEVVPLPPGAPLVLDGPADAALVAAGALQRYDGEEVRRGSVIGPFGNDAPGEAAVARTHVRVWRFPGLANVSPLPPGPHPLAGAGGVHAASDGGVHSVRAPAPLVVPPGPPSQDIDRDADGHFERHLRWLLVLVLSFAVLLTGTNFWPAPAWAEMPADRVLAQVESGTAKVTVEGRSEALDAGADRYLGAGDRILTGTRSAVRLTFRGGSVAVLCAGSELGVGELFSPSGHPIQPTGRVSLAKGRMLVDTASGSSAFWPFVLTAETPAGLVATQNLARLTVEPTGTQVAVGKVTVAGAPVAASGTAPTCGDGRSLPQRPTIDPSSQPPPPTLQVDPPSESPSASPSASESASSAPATPRATATRGPVVPPPVPTTAGPPSPKSPTPSPSTSSPTPRSPDPESPSPPTDDPTIIG
jgi:putative peptide zinc metalloprotease protein